MSGWPLDLNMQPFFVSGKLSWWASAYFNSSFILFLPNPILSYSFLLWGAAVELSKAIERPWWDCLTTLCLRTSSLYYISLLLKFLLFLNMISFLAGFRAKDYRNIKLKEKATQEKKKRWLFSKNRKKRRTEESHPIVPRYLLIKSSEIKRQIWWLKPSLPRWREARRTGFTVWAHICPAWMGHWGGNHDIFSPSISKSKQATVCSGRCQCMHSGEREEGSNYLPRVHIAEIYNAQFHHQ